MTVLRELSLNWPMMTMMMMQRLLQENANDKSASLGGQNLSPRAFSFTNGGNILHHHPSSAFLRPPSTRSEDTRDSGKECEDEGSESDKREPAEEDAVCRTSEGDDCKSRVSEESMDVAERNDRLSSDEDFLNVDDELGSPVDLTSRHRLLHRLHRTMASSPSSVSEGNDEPPHPRRLAFSVENILDPTKFTGKDREAALLRPLDLDRFQAHWRPLDPDLINHSGKLKNRTSYFT